MLAGTLIIVKCYEQIHPDTKQMLLAEQQAGLGMASQSLQMLEPENKILEVAANIGYE